MMNDFEGSEELRVAILPVTLEPHCGISLVKVALVSRALCLTFIASLTCRSGIRSRSSL